MKISFYWLVLFVLYLVTFSIAQCVAGLDSILWVAHSNHALVLLFISLVEFYKCILGANVLDFEIFKTVVVIIFRTLSSLKILQGVPYHLKSRMNQNHLAKFNQTWHKTECMFIQMKDHILFQGEMIMK